MSFHIDKTVEWKAGVGTPTKYSFRVQADVDVVSVSGATATIRMVGSIGVQNYPNNSRNSFAASDFAVLTLGGKDPADYQFTEGTAYYMNGLPTLPNAPQSYVDAVIAEFRGDTYIQDGPNRVSLYEKNSGVVVNTYNGDVYQSHNFDDTFTIDVSGGGNIPIVIWNTSGCSSSTSYRWLEHQVWVSWIDLDYRPGMTLDSNWQSHNRGSGASNIYNNGWNTMRTVGGPDATGNPPYIYNNGWHNQRRIGNGG